MTSDERIDRFVAAAKSFRRFVQRAAALELPERLGVARIILAELHAAACDLPRGAVIDFDAMPSEALPPEWPGFEDFEFYWEIFDPYELDSAVAGALSEDVANIYDNLERGFADLAGGGDLDAVVWQWRHSFEAQWGERASSALRALHFAYARVDDD